MSRLFVCYEHPTSREGNAAWIVGHLKEAHNIEMGMIMAPKEDAVDPHPEPQLISPNEQAGLLLDLQDIQSFAEVICRTQPLDETGLHVLLNALLCLIESTVSKAAQL